MTMSSDGLLDAAAEVADGWNHHWLGTEHVLVAYLEAERKADLRPFLTDARLSADDAEAFVKEQVPPRNEREEGKAGVLHTPRVATIRGFAHGWAAANSWPDRPTVTGEHLLLALLIDGEGVGAQAVRQQDVNVENLIITLGNWLTSA